MNTRDAEIKRLYEAGNAYAKVAQMLGMPPSSVYTRLQAIGAKIRPSSRRERPATDRKYMPGSPDGCACPVCKKAGNR